MFASRASSLLLAACLLTLTTLNPWGPQARANGRPPGTTGITAAPAGGTAPEGQTQLLGLTFGLGVSHDSGKSFRWVCEEAIGGPTGVDALIAAPSANTLLTGSSKGLYVSKDGGCDWQAEPLFAPPSQVSALATDPTAPNHWYVAVNVPQQGRGFVYVTRDAGLHYSKLTVGADGVYLYGIALAHPKAHPKTTTLAVVGSNNGAHDSCLLMTSKDGGTTWHKSAVKGAPPASATPLVAIDAHEPNTLLVTALDITTNGSLALLSHDFGATFAAMGRIEEPVRNIMFDGPANGVAQKSGSIATTGHVWRFNAQGEMAVLPVPKSNACIGRVDDRLLVCGSSADHQDGFALAQSTDGGRALKTILGLTDILPPQCPAETSSQKACAALWTNQAAAIAAAAHADPAAEFIPSEQSAQAPIPTLSPTLDAEAAKTPKAQGCRCGLGSGEGGFLLVALWAPLIAYRVRQRLRAR